MAEDVEAREEFQQVVEGYIEQLREKEATSVGERYKEIKKILHKAAEETLPEAPTKVNGYVKYSSDTILLELSETQRRLSARIYHKTSKRNARKIEKLKRRRNQVFKAITQRRRELARQHVDNLVGAWSTAPARVKLTTLREC